jgi:hypothetical protein
MKPHRKAGHGPRIPIRDEERLGLTSLKRLVAFFGAMFLTIACAAADCVNADPWLELAGVQGDFELTVDPQDRQQNLILVANLSDGTATVVAARINGSTGRVMWGSLTTIAKNFYGQSALNGPEFVQKPSGELGVVYAGHGGVHAVFRPTAASRWDQFKFDVAGARTFGTPPPLSNTSDGAYPRSLPLGQHTYGQALGGCGGYCYGALEGGPTTDVRAALAARGFTARTATQSSRDGYILIGACDTSDACGLYEAAIDHAGDFIAGSFQELASTGKNVLVALVAARHPGNGSTVIFGNRSNLAVEAWEQPAVGGKATLVGSVPLTTDGHYRAVTTKDMVVLTYLIRDGVEAGTYTLPVTATGDKLQMGNIMKVSSFAGGAELAWLPAADKWAIFYRNENDRLTRCWVTP